MTSQEKPFAILAFGSEAPADLLVNAASVTRFLADVSGAFTSDKGEIGLGDQSANGLCLILLAVESTINEALTRI
jgi:hypothetical protein